MATRTKITHKTPYVGGKSPFVFDKALGQTFKLLKYSDVAANYRPKINVAVGKWVCDVKKNIAGECIKVAQVNNRLGTWVTIKPTKSKRTALRNLENCVAVPKKNEFIRSNATAEWFKITAVTAKHMKVFQVLSNDPGHIVICI